jgi:hypothetical protein
MIFPVSSRRHRFGPWLLAIALAALLTGATHRDIPPAWGRDALVAPHAENASSAPESQPHDRPIETLTAAWLYPLLAAPVLVRLLESDAP